MGADRGVHLKTTHTTPDSLVIARALADELRGGGYDLLLFGRVAVDSGNGATAAMVAELLISPA